jgi:hypothetical protein
MKTTWLSAILSLYLLTGFTNNNDTRITSYGALADGITNNARYIQKAIDVVAAKGGGRVIVPLGNFMTGTIFLKSGVDLHLEQGACLLGPTDRNEYTGERGGLIEAKSQKNISITGPGIIDGQAHELLLDIFKKLRSGEINHKDSTWLVKRPGEGERTFILSIDNCTDVHISGITLKNSSAWVQNYTECNNLTIEGIKVQSTAYWNNDGLDVTDSKNVIIKNCFINSADDGICLKSGNPNFYCENIFVDSCTIRSSASAFKLGTASGGGFKNIKVRNLNIFDTYRSAIAIECVDGGNLENIDIQNILARNTGNAIFIRRGQRNKNGKVGTLKGVYIANVKVDVPLYKPDQGYPTEGPPDHIRPGIDKMPKRPGSYHIFGHPWLPYNLVPSSIVGIPGYPVEDVTLENIEITYGGRASKDIAYIPLDSITSIPENASQYPEFSMFGELPAWGFYVRHAEGVKMKNVTVKYVQDDFRPAFVFDDVKGVDMDGVDIPTAKDMPIILFNNSSGIEMKNLKMPVTEAKGILKTDFK